MAEPTGAASDAPVKGEAVRIVFLGGLGEIGRNCMAIELGGGPAGDGPERQIMLIDCGLMFPDPDMHGIDLVLPDFTYLRENAARIVAVVATHGHEDHVGALQYLLREISVPIYGSAVTLGLARNRIEEAGLLGNTELRVVADNERVQIGPFDVEFLPVTHSVPHAHAIAVHTPQGVVLHTGDFKLDLTPVDGRRTDLARIGELARTEGIRVLLADSTNSEEPGHAPSETTVGGVLRTLFAECRGRRVITASFASHLHRIQQIADAAIESGRKVATLGMSIRKNVQLGIDLGIVSIPASKLIDIEDIDRYPPGEVCVISTGSQGEPMSALALLARGENKFVKLSENDTVILSSHAIPGNESNVNRVMDGLLRAGAQVVHSGTRDVHATGHAQADELKTYLSIAQPQWYVPIHGEYRHLVANAEIGTTMGVPRDRVLVCEDGDVLVVADDGVEAGWTGPRRLPLCRRDRRRCRPRCAARSRRAGVRGRRRGRRHGRHAVRQGAHRTRDHHPRLGVRARGRGPSRRGVRHDRGDRRGHPAKGVRDVEMLERDVRRAAGRFVSERTRRRPMIVPVVMEA